MTFLRWARTQWDRVAAWLLISVGGVFIVVGWVRVGREALTAQQIPYVISGGIGGLFLLGVGAMLWLSADLRDEWRKLDEIARGVSADTESSAAQEDQGAPPPPSRLEAASNGSSRSAHRRVAPLQGR